MRRIERLVNLIAALLDTPRPLAAEEIRERVAGYESGSKEAFRRTFERDKSDLRAAGIPIELKVVDPLTDSEGYYIPKDRYYLPAVELEPDELAALRLAAAALVGDDDIAATGALKLSIDSAADPVPRPPFVWSSAVATESAILGDLYAAVLDRKTVAFAYPGAEGSERRRLDPYAIAHRRGRWYVVGRDHDRDAIRSFRVSRIQGSVGRAGDSFAAPQEFSVDEHIGGEAFAVGAEEDIAVVRFNAAIRWWAEQNLASHPRNEAPGGGIDVTLPLGNVEALISFVLGFGAMVEIKLPRQARDALVQHVRSSVGGSPR